MKTKSLLTVVVLGFLVLQACQNANKNSKEIQSAAIDPTLEKDAVTDTSGLNRGTNLFVFFNEVALDDLMQIELGEIAQEKAVNSKVKDFARTVVKDHTKIAEQLKKLATDKRLSLPTELPQEDKNHIAEMKNMSGNDFDKHYIGMMVKDHIKALDLFKSASTSGDTPLQNFAIRNLRTLEEHYKTATAINDHLK